MFDVYVIISHVVMVDIKFALFVRLSVRDASALKLLNRFGWNFAQGWRSVLDVVSCILWSPQGSAVEPKNVVFLRWQ